MTLARRRPRDDDTVVLPRPGSRKPRRRGALVVMIAGVAGGLAAAALVAWRFPPGPPPEAVVPSDIPALPLATEAELAAETPRTLTLHRFAANPRILVFDFPTLRQQGMMFNRIAALVEKSGAPHDRLLSDAELAAALRQGGDTTETYYYGHDYSSRMIARFFTLADVEHVALNADETTLRGIAAAQGLLARDAGQAIITLPALNADGQVDDAFRRTVLHHELAHGEYFTDAAYASYVGHFYHDVLDLHERAAFSRFLGSQAYDTAIEDLMANEMQAYLVFTPDQRIFNPAVVGLDAATISRLRAAFVAGMQAGWLRDGAAAR
jgi:hypothetical protein